MAGYVFSKSEQDHIDSLKLNDYQKNRVNAIDWDFLKNRFHGLSVESFDKKAIEALTSGAVTKPIWVRTDVKKYAALIAKEKQSGAWLKRDEVDREKLEKATVPANRKYAFMGQAQMEEGSKTEVKNFWIDCYDVDQRRKYTEKEPIYIENVHVKQGDRKSANPVINSTEIKRKLLEKGEWMAKDGKPMYSYRNPCAGVVPVYFQDKEGNRIDKPVNFVVGMDPNTGRCFGQPLNLVKKIFERTTKLYGTVIEGGIPQDKIDNMLACKADSSEDLFFLDKVSTAQNGEKVVTHEAISYSPADNNFVDWHPSVLDLEVTLGEKPLVSSLNGLAEVWAKREANAAKGQEQESSNVNEVATAMSNATNKSKAKDNDKDNDLENGLTI